MSLYLARLDALGEVRQYSVERRLMPICRSCRVALRIFELPRCAIVGTSLSRGHFEREQNAGNGRVCQASPVVSDGADTLAHAGGRVQPRQPGHGFRLFNAGFRTFFPRLHWLYRAKYFRCWGSGCMMWRWEGPGSRRGYCGLAGSPLALGLADEPLEPGERL